MTNSNTYAYQPSIDPIEAKAAIRNLKNAIKNADKIVTQISCADFPRVGPHEINFLQSLADVTAHMRGLWDNCETNCFPTLREAVEYSSEIQDEEPEVSDHPLLQTAQDLDEIDRLLFEMTIEANEKIPID